MGIACGTVLFLQGIVTGIIKLFFTGAILGGATGGLLVGGVVGIGLALLIFVLGTYFALNFALKHLGLIVLLVLLPFLLC